MTAADQEKRGGKDERVKPAFLYEVNLKISNQSTTSTTFD